MRCFDEAEQELSALGLKVAAFVTYQYEEGFSDAIMICPKYDKKILSSRIYYRLVLPTQAQSNPCQFKSGSSVVVLFTSFAGTDPHELLLQSAVTKNMTVFFGLPSVPLNYSKFGFDDELMPAYYAFASRVLQEHKSRYSSMFIGSPSHWISVVDRKSRSTIRHTLAAKSLYDFLKGYHSTDECCLAQVTSESIYLKLYRSLGTLTHKFSKLFAVSPFVDLIRSKLNATVQQHVTGFKMIAATAVVDVIAVQEGRGAGKGCYYWPTQIDLPVKMVDAKLDEIIHYRNPSLKENITYREVFSASNQELFHLFGEAQDAGNRNGLNFEYWLEVEAFEYLRNDPCLPVDPAASGMAELLQRTTKSRLDRALTVAGAAPKKVISFAFDSDFTCTTKEHNFSISNEIRHDFARPVISNCSFHSRDNVSVVVIGYNLDGMGQKFEVDWPDRDGSRHQDQQYGYYYEIDWGIEHNRVPSLVYIMLWDLPEVNLKLAPKGHVKVSADGAYHECIFTFDYSA